MKYLLLWLNLCMAVFCYGQDKLKMEVTKAGDTLYSTSDKKIYTAPGSKNASGEILKSSFYKSASRYMLCLQIETGRTSVFTVSSEEPAEILFTDGSTLSLYSRSSNNSHRKVSNYGGYIFVFYTVGGQDLSKLQATDIKTILVTTSAGKMTYDIKDKNAGVIRSQAGAINQ
jgi:hypothetical protein